MMENKISISDSMRSAFFLWKKYFVKIIAVGFIVYLPAQICIELAEIQLDKVFINEAESIQVKNRVYDMIRYIIGAVAMIGIINFIVKILDNEEEQTIGEIILHGLRRWPKFMEVGLYAGFKIFVRILLLIIPGIHKAIQLSFVDCVVSTKYNVFTDACGKSEDLVKNYWWKVFGFLLLVFVFGFLFEFLLSLPLLLHPELFKYNILIIAIAVIISVLETYFIVVKAVYYFNLKQLKSEKKT